MGGSFIALICVLVFPVMLQRLNYLVVPHLREVEEEGYFNYPLCVFLYAQPVSTRPECYMVMSSSNPHMGHVTITKTAQG